MQKVHEYKGSTIRGVAGWGNLGLVDFRYLAAIGLQGERGQILYLLIYLVNYAQSLRSIFKSYIELISLKFTFQFFSKLAYLTRPPAAAAADRSHLSI